ncbi:menaquinone-dependent protoporphyrinogen oxidase [Kribbella pratensis]|uniref:Menaquinone-dependent protoporphyrinogen oxidase n=1 Tax=Kribbella pratensis TaxID=2512112 RepID=A0ABY2FI72_9ACTN|nr:flavodoxin domain-containing protein [Kribbella pratensis]TDW92824.1 menaquinone-dependent protoporphyrinogen oxidase [Kribbella pratensis]
MSKKVLVAYASKMGATAGIAAAIGDELRAHGHSADVAEVTSVNDVAPYDAVVLGSAIYVRRWRRDAVRFLRHNVAGLRQRQVWLFHSGPVGPDKDEDQTMPPAVRHLARSIGATPAVTFAGRLEPATAKGFLARRLAAGKLAGDARDWDKIRAWSADVSAAIEATQRSTWHRPPANHSRKRPAGHFLG